MDIKVNKLLKPATAGAGAPKFNNDRLVWLIPAALVDVFPEFEEIDGYKLKSLKEIKKDFLELLNSNIRSHWKQDIENKLKLLQ